MAERIQFSDDHSTWTIERSDEPGQPPIRMVRKGQGIENMDRDFDVAYWQALGSDAISRAAWELVELYLITKGRADDIRLRRHVGGFKRIRRKVSHRRGVRGNELHGAPIHEGP
ncbi:MAG TPA: hypothetical protein VKT77_17190 [Chthonomonadaceae bacterium]|nr:hypothetical protein [Chthonomonadaceae bacterium]